jgi:uncharacterized protein YpbB
MLNELFVKYNKYHFQQKYYERSGNFVYTYLKGRQYMQKSFDASRRALAIRFS